MITTLDFENDTHTNEIIDVDVYEKRRRDDILRQPRLEDNILPHAPLLRALIPSISLSNLTPEIVMQEVQDNCHSTTSGIPDAAPKKLRYVSKYRFLSWN